ncbi:SUMF1/EgtB/PvdO family nonheme iron enzyme [Bernardetia sp.]|uniref:SUMF1/EgtB/PvdO family nonheme iron enzyme n=1 Tax=Bernardetia sp. TaxID=1937974 RepID=UPI0025BB4895|nr:SUMF1/EgtB/PvdO family nonheme iron enzyme [Bernardetia sp.]
MRKLLFILLGFALFPIISSAQVISHTMEDSVLTVFINPLKKQVEAHTIYPNEVPKKINFVFEDVAHVPQNSYIIITLARGIQPIKEHTYSNLEGKINEFPVSYVVWQDEYFLIDYNEPKEDSVIMFRQKLKVFPKPILEEIRKREQQRINDSIQKIENHLATVEYYQKRFEKLKQPQENLTDKDKKILSSLSNTIPVIASRIKEQTFIDETEISVINWLEYLMLLKSDSSEQHYELAFPNTTVWQDLYGMSDFDELYLNYPTYRFYPIVGITYEQAQAYCIWRGNMVSQYINEKQKKKYKDYEVTVQFRLPTKEEWEYAAIKDDLNKQFGGYSSKRPYTEKEKRKIYRSAKNYIDSTRTLEEVKLDMKNYFESDSSFVQLFNYKQSKAKPYFLYSNFIFDEILTNWIYSYSPTKHFQLYNIFENVAEMTSEKGIAKGGSFAHTLEECAADSVQKYDAPKAWLGFRCVAEVVVRKKNTE